MSSFCQRGAEKRRSRPCWQEMRLRDQEVGSYSAPSPRPMSPKNQLEQDKRVRREIANSNERRRMQSINAGFQSLKTIIPHTDGEKLSKAAILQSTSDYVYQLEQDKSQLLAENTELKQVLRDLGHNPLEILTRRSPPPKRKKRDTESSDEGIGLTCVDSEDHSIEDIKREMLELRKQLEAERKRRTLLEEKTRGGKLNEEPEDSTVKTYRKNKDMLMQKWLKDSRDVEASEHVPRPGLVPSPPPKPAVSATNTAVGDTAPQPASFSHSCNSLSRRNLDTIVEAIRHLEGDAVLVDLQDERSVPASCKNLRIPHSEESGTESSYDQEDARSESSATSGRDSPVQRLLSPMDCETGSATTTTKFTATVHISPPLPSHVAHLSHTTPTLDTEVLQSRHPSLGSGAAPLPDLSSSHHKVNFLQKAASAMSLSSGASSSQLPQLLAQKS